MDIISSLFLDENRCVSNIVVRKSNFIIECGLYLRIYCKEENVDDKIAVALDKSVIEDEVLYKKTKGLLEDHSFIRTVTGKKVFFQLKNDKRIKNLIFDVDIPDENGFLSIEFNSGVIKGSIVLNSIAFFNLVRMIDGNLAAGMRIFRENNLDELRKYLYRRISSPPKNFTNEILTLDDIDLQLVLNRLLHKKLVSADMLASYVYVLGNGGEKIMKNLSRSNRELILGKIIKQKIYSTSRLANQVLYVINRNMLRSADELGLKIGRLDKLMKLRLHFSYGRLEKQLSFRGFSQWFEYLDVQGLLPKFLNACPRNSLINAVDYSLKNENGGIIRTLERHISKSGIAILKEDMEALDNDAKNGMNDKMKSLLICFRCLKDIYYEPVVKEMIEKEIYRDKCISLLQDVPGSIDLVLDEIGVPKTIYGLKSAGNDLADRILSGVVKTLYYDVINRRIRFSEYGDYSIDECKYEFLKTLLIMRDEGVI